MKIEDSCAIHICAWGGKVLADVEDYFETSIVTTDAQRLTLYRELVGILTNLIDRWLDTRYPTQQRLALVNSIVSRSVKSLKAMDVKPEAELRDMIQKMNSEWWLRDSAAIIKGGLFPDIANHICLIVTGKQKDFHLYLLKNYFQELNRELIAGVSAQEFLKSAYGPEYDKLAAETIFKQTDECELSLLTALKH